MLIMFLFGFAFEDGKLFLALSGGQGAAARQGEQFSARNERQRAPPTSKRKKVRSKASGQGLGEIGRDKADAVGCCQAPSPPRGKS